MRSFLQERRTHHLSPNMKVAWERLIRFVAADGRTLRGEPILPSPDYDIGFTTEQDELKAKVIVGSDIFSDAKVTEEIATVKQLLGPLTADEVPILRCIGLNYAKHSMFRSNLGIRTRSHFSLHYSQRDRSNTTTFPVFLHQTQHLGHRPRCISQNSKDCTR